MTPVLGNQRQFYMASRAVLRRATSMATEQLPGSAPAPVVSQQIQPLQAWLARLGLSGKLLAIGGLVGIIAVFLPLSSVSMQMNTADLSKAFGGKGVNVPAINLPSVSRSVMVIGDWRGI